MNASAEVARARATLLKDERVGARREARKTPFWLLSEKMDEKARAQKSVSSEDEDQKDQVLLSSLFPTNQMELLRRIFLSWKEAQSQED